MTPADIRFPQLVEMDPVVVLDDQLYVNDLGRRPNQAPPVSRVPGSVPNLELRTGRTSSPLKPFVDLAWCLDLFRRRMAGRVRGPLLTALMKGCTLTAEHLVASFLDLVAAFAAHDVGCAHHGGQRGRNGGSAATEIEDDVRKFVEGVTLPALPQPALMHMGRVQPLSPCRVGAPAGRLHVAIGDQLFIPGAPVATLAPPEAFLDAGAVTEWVAETVKEKSPPPPAAPSAEVRDAVREFEANGAVRRGDLLLLRGSPPMLAAVLPPHESKTFMRQSRDDLAVATDVDPRTGQVAAGDHMVVLERDSASGTWRRAEPQPLVRLGAWPRHKVDSGDAGVAAASLLRLAAVRFATQGLFSCMEYHRMPVRGARR